MFISSIFIVIFQAPNNQIVYTIMNSKTAEFYFYLDPKTGHIYLKQCTTGKELLFVVILYLLLHLASNFEFDDFSYLILSFNLHLVWINSGNLFWYLFVKFNVTATDRGFPALSYNAIINVEIKECPKCKTNLHSPRFFAPIYFVNIREGNYSKTNLNLIQVI